MRHMPSEPSSSPEEFLSEYRRQQQEWRDEQLLARHELIRNFKSVAGSAGVQLSDSNFDYVQTIGIIASAPQLLTKLLPRLPRDRDGLYPFADLTKALTLGSCQPGYLSAPSFMAMAHPRFRRGLHEVNSFAPRFIECFWQLTSDGAIRYLALDADRVRIDIDEPTYSERDTWFGALFNQDVVQIPSGVAKLRPPLDVKGFVVSCLFADAYCLDIQWTAKENIKSFQALEFKSDTVTVEHQGRTYFPARYIHAEFDISTRAFRHFDGAIQYYSEQEYFQRRDTDFNHNAKHVHHLKSQSEKLFKVNGKLAIDEWVNLCCHFFAGNPLAIEYFSGKYPIHVDEALSKVRGRGK